MSDFKSNYEDFETPIKELVGEEGFNYLTEPAKQLLEGDLVALSWKNHTDRTQRLTPRDLHSIEEAFRTNPFFGNSKSELVGGSCCCCTAPCCCTAAAVVESVG